MPDLKRGTGTFSSSSDSKDKAGLLLSLKESECRECEAMTVKQKLERGLEIS